MEHSPDAWPSPGLKTTIAESHAFFHTRRVLVTGAFGFVGGHLVRALHATGAAVVALDKDTSSERGSLLNLTGLRDEIEVVEADVTDRNAMQAMITEGRYDVIYHLAAETPTIDEALYAPHDIILTDTLGFVNLVEAARHLPTDERPVILLASTDKTGGEAGQTTPASQNEYEDKIGRGLGVYDASKLAAEILASTYHYTLGVPTIVLRLCNLFGPYDFNDNLRLMPKALRNIFRDHEAPELYFNAMEHYRDYAYVEDAVRAFLLLAPRAACRGHVYDLPGVRYGATPDVLRDLIDLISDLQGEVADITPDAAFARHRWNRTIRIVKSDPRPTVAHKPRTDGTRLYAQADFEPSLNFRTALTNTIHYYYWYFTQIAPGSPQEPETQLHATSPTPSLPLIAPITALPMTTTSNETFVDEQDDSTALKPTSMYETLWPRQQPAPIEDEEFIPDASAEVAPLNTTERQPYVLVYKLESKS